MNKPIAIASALVTSVLMVVVAASSDAHAQYYSAGGGGGQTATPQQLQECQQLNIPQGTCSDLTILAKKRLTSAESTTYGNAPTGSGTAMLANISDPNSALGQMAIYVGALGAIFGGVAAAFFLKGRSSKQVTT